MLGDVHENEACCSRSLRPAAVEPAQAAEVKVLASGAVKEAALELFPQFEKASGNKVAVTWAGTVDIKKKIAAGEVFDLVIVASPELDTFAKDGKIVSRQQGRSGAAPASASR